MRKRILVTGGAGFFGHHLVEHILKNTEWDIVVLDSLNYASFGFDRIRDVGCYDVRRVERFVHNIVSPMELGLRRELGQFNFILHAAAETHVDNSIKNPLPFVETNVLGTARLLEFSRTQEKLETFLFFSTDEVFGPAAVTNLNVQYSGHNLSLYSEYREWDRHNPTNPYSATKAAGEELCLAWSNTYRIPVIITHCMNIFGERQHPEKFIPHVVRSILSEKEILIHSSPSGEPGSRFYIHARNVAAAVLFILGKVDELPHRDKFNITGEAEVNNLELANAIADLLRKPVKIRQVDFHSSRPGHDLRYALDGTKLARLGWKPPVSFEPSLAKTINWFVSNPKWLEYETQ